MQSGETLLFERMKTKLGWLERRQRVLAEAVANADTPGYRPRDLAPPRFSEAIAAIGLATTRPLHLAGREGSRAAVAAGAAPSYEAAPAGNAVVLEEQMAKISETTLAHNLTTQLYRKYLGLMRTATQAKG